MNRNEVFAPAQLAHYEFAVDIGASLSQVWQALTAQLGEWWLPEFHMLGESQVELELRAGGRLFEKAEGRELLWFNVVAFEQERSIELVGACTAKFGGPTTTMLSLELEELGDRQTRLQFTDSLIGRVSEESLRCLEAGWKELIVNGLKKYVEAQHPSASG